MEDCSQYQRSLYQIIRHGIRKEKTIQGESQIVCLSVTPMVFHLEKEAPLITERDCSSFYRSAIGEIFAFVNGVHTQKGLEEFGCRWWKDWVTSQKCRSFGLETGDLGPGSYGPAFANFPTPDGKGFNQFEALVEQIKRAPYLATHEISPWVPYLVFGPERKVVVAPCHGWLHFEVLGGRLHMIMSQRSADFPVGVPSNMIQYAALLLAIAQVTGYPPGTFVHQFRNAHVYQSQLSAVREMLNRKTKPLPKLIIKPSSKGITELCEFRASDFEIQDYQPHPGIKIPVAI